MPYRHISNCLNSSTFERAGFLPARIPRSRHDQRRRGKGREGWAGEKCNPSGLGHRYAGNLSYARGIEISASASNRGEDMQSRVCVHCSPFLPLPSRQSLPPFLHSSRETSGLAQFAVLVHASLEDTHRTSYVYTRVYTPRTSQISTLREHTNKPANHACICSIRPCLCVISPLVLPLARHIVLLSFLYSSCPCPYSHPFSSQCPTILLHSDPRDLELSHARTRVFESGKKCTEVYEILWAQTQDILLIWDTLSLERKALLLRSASIKPITQRAIIV